MLSEGAAIFADLIVRFLDRTSDVLKKHVETGKTENAIKYLHAKAAQEKRRAALATDMRGFRCAPDVARLRRGAARARADG
jgi:hypothetical protein